MAETEAEMTVYGRARAVLNIIVEWGMDGDGCAQHVGRNYG